MNHFFTTFHKVCKCFLQIIVIQYLFASASAAGISQGMLQKDAFGMESLANAQANKSVRDIVIELPSPQGSAKQFFNEIENQTKFVFNFDERKIQSQVNRRLIAQSRSTSLYNLLVDISHQTKLHFVRINDNISVKLLKIRKKNAAVKESYESDPVTITGTVTDENGDPLPGVTIRVKGTTIGTVSNADGTYRLEVPDGSESVLLFTFVGYYPLEAGAGNLTVVNVTMLPDVTALAGAVVIGYGTQSKKNSSGAIAKLGGDGLKDIPANSTLQGLQGRIPGLVITRSDGQPGQELFNIQIRGASTVNGGSPPLIIIDGIPGTQQALQMLNPADIESYTVLKDAAAAVYGARASNGVILVTTRMGKGKPQVSVNTSYSIRRRAPFPKPLNSWQIFKMGREYDKNSKTKRFAVSDKVMQALKNETGEAFEAPGLLVGDKFYAKTWDYAAMSFDMGHLSNTDVSISGATDKFSYRGSFGFMQENGLLKHAPQDDNQRINGRFNMGFQPYEKLKVDARIGFSRQVTKSPTTPSLRSIIFRFPFMRPYTLKDPTKFAAYGAGGSGVSAMQDMAEGGNIQTYDTRIEPNLKADYKIADKLTLTGQAGANFSFSESNTFSRTFATWDEETAVFRGYRNSPNSGAKTSGSSVYYTLMGYLNYSNKFADLHDLSVTAGASHEESDQIEFLAGRTGFITNEFSSLNLGSTGSQTNASMGDSQWVIRSLFGRASYVLADKYILELNTRYDGSSRFAADVRWGFFWGASAAWQLGEERFVKNLNVFDVLKLRLSHSQTGNQSVGDYGHIQRIHLNSFNTYPFGQGSGTQAARVGELTDPTRTWEKLVTTNVGLDFTVLDNRLSGSFDYFVKNNVNMLVPQTGPTLVGSIYPAGNNGKLRTKGWEAVLNWGDQVGSDFSYDISINMGDAESKVLEYSGIDTYQEGEVFIREGYAMDTYHGWVFDGIIQNEKELKEYQKKYDKPGSHPSVGLAQVGDARYKDVNGDGLISAYGKIGEDGKLTDGDVIPLGDATLRYNYGINLRLGYKGFELSAFLQGVGQKNILMGGGLEVPFSSGATDPPAPWFWNTTWSPERRNVKYPRIHQLGYDNFKPSTNTLLDASYIRLKNVNIGYNLPENITRAMGVEMLKVYVAGFDLWEMHNLPKGLDPEALSGGYASPSSYPFSRMYSLGLNITF